MQGLVQCVGCVGDFRHQVFRPPFQATGTGPGGVALRAEQPPAQFGGLHTRQVCGERAVRGVEDVVPLVEDISRGHQTLIQAAKRRLHHDQGMIGHDNPRRLARRTARSMKHLS